MTSPATRAQVYAAIDGERAYQNSKGTIYHGTPPRKPVEAYLVYMQDYLREAIEQASRIWGEGSEEAVLNTIRKVTALGVACMEDNGAPPRAY